MAEFCFSCYKKILKGEKGEHELLISKDYDLYEGCGEYKHVIIRYRNSFEILFGFLLGSNK